MKALIIESQTTKDILNQFKVSDLEIQKVNFREISSLESFSEHKILICALNKNGEVFEYLTRMKKLYPSTYFIILSSQKNDEFLEKCFNGFADDFIHTDTSLLEIKARIEAKVREISKTKSKENNLSWEEIKINISNQKAFIKYGIKEFKDILLSPIEYKLLVYLAKAPYRVIERKSLLKDVWGLNPDISTRSVDIHISKLRKKLGPYSNILKTIRGRGYKFLPTTTKGNV